MHRFTIPVYLYIATHAHHLARFITGLEVSDLSAELSTIVSGRQGHANAHVQLRFNNGVKGMMWASRVAVGFPPSTISQTIVS